MIRTGAVPDAQQSPTRTFMLNTMQTPVSININTFENGGLALGYGTGLRSTLLGYFLRVDAAWNIDGRKTPIWYVAIGLDF